MPADFTTSLRSEALAAPPSGIVEVMNYGRGRDGLVPLWVGEGDLPTPRFIVDAATRSLAAGETFYTWQRGIPELRAALARYHERLFGRPFDSERFFVTSSGMHAIATALAMLAGPGDEVIVPTPAWPNFAAATGLAGARAVEAPMSFGNAGWALDFDLIADLITPRTKVLFLNSPCNPTGWTASREDLAHLLDLARRAGIWIVADEVYTRFVFDGATRAPSFHDVATPEDKIIYVNTFSKNWAMTGWRVGWIEADPSLGQVIENLIQYSSSGTPVFVQRGAVAALDHGEGFVAHQIERAGASRKVIVDALRVTGQVRFADPGAFYLFFSVDGEPDTSSLGLRLVDEANVGLAPGTAFGGAGQGFLRLCFARGPESMTEVARRLVKWLEIRGRIGP